MPDLLIFVVEDRDLFLLLQHLDFLALQNIRRRHRQALVGRVGSPQAFELQFPVPLHDLRCLGSQDRIGVISDKLIDVALAENTRAICDRAWTR